MRAVFRIDQVGPFTSIQDAGRPGYARFGVTKSGPMDRLANQLTHYALGKDMHSAAIEISLGGLVLTCQEGEITAAIGGGHFSVNLDGNELAPWSLFTLREGSILKIRAGEWGSWCYLSFLGDIQTKEWLGSSAVHLVSNLCGSAYSQGDKIIVENAKVNRDLSGTFLDIKRHDKEAGFHVVQGPQDHFFAPQSIKALYASEYKLSSEYDRMGVRLEGQKLDINQALDMPSAPVARGSLQVPGHGQPICLLADHQTTGGYPKIATMISGDQDAFAQKRVGDAVHFIKIGVDDAINMARKRHLETARLKEEIDGNSSSLIHRLWSHNLISGVVGPSQ